MNKKMESKYLRTEDDIRSLVEDCPAILSSIKIADLQPHGLFIPSIPSLMPPHGDERLWTVTTESWYIASDGTVIHMQIGDKTDLASTPRTAKFIFNGAGRETPIAVVHDEGYSQVNKRRYNIITKEYSIPTQKWWDKTFKSGCLLCKTNWIKAKVYYRALRMFGWIAWSRYRRKSKAAK